MSGSNKYSNHKIKTIHMQAPVRFPSLDTYFHHTIHDKYPTCSHKITNDNYKMVFFFLVELVNFDVLGWYTQLQVLDPSGFWLNNQACHFLSEFQIISRSNITNLSLPTIHNNNKLWHIHQRLLHKKETTPIKLQQVTRIYIPKRNSRLINNISTAPETYTNMLKDQI